MSLRPWGAARGGRADQPPGFALKPRAAPARFPAQFQVPARQVTPSSPDPEEAAGTKREPAGPEKFPREDQLHTEARTPRSGAERTRRGTESTARRCVALTSAARVVCGVSACLPAGALLEEGRSGPVAACSTERPCARRSLRAPGERELKQLLRHQPLQPAGTLGGTLSRCADPRSARLPSGSETRFVSLTCFYITSRPPWSLQASAVRKPSQT